MIVDFSLSSTLTDLNIFSLVPEVSEYKNNLDLTFDLIRLEFGKMDIKNYYDNNINIYNMKFFINNKKERNYLINFFNNVKGNLKGFWFPTYIPELKFISNLDVEYVFIDNNFKYIYNGYEKLAFFDYKNNIIQVRNIVDTYLNESNNLVIKVDSVFDLKEGEYDEYLFFKFVYGRFISNSLKFKYEFNVMDNLITTISLQFKELPMEVV